MTFEEWFSKHQYDINRCNAEEGWDACLEHARQEFLQREIDRIKQGKPDSFK